jgi:zinc protease
MNRQMARVVIACVAIAALLIALPIGAKEEPPPPGKMKKLSFPSFKEFTTRNNIDVVVVEHHEQPIVTISIVLKTGTAYDPADKVSLADFTVGLLNQGTTDKDSNALATWIESVGGRFEAYSGDDFSTIRINILSEYLDTAYEYLQDILFNPVFPEDELEEYRKRVKTALELELSDPNSMATRHFTNVVYGDHPYAKQPTVESVESITRDDIVAFYKKNFVANNALIMVVGDVKWKNVNKAVEQYFGKWQEGDPDVVTYTAPPEMDASTIYLYHRPGAVQTNLRVGHLGLMPTNPDWAAINVANKLFGGGGDARLFMNLREDKGWTYGIYSNFSKRKDVGEFAVRGAVRTEVTDSALVELNKEFERITEEPVGQDELDQAKSYLLGNFPLGIETPDEIAGKVVNVKLLGLGKKYLEEYRKEIAKVTVEDVQRVMAKYLQPNNMAYVLVGDATEIHDKVGELAKVALYDLEGAPLSIDELTITPVDYVYNTDLIKDMKAVYTISVPQMSLGDLNMNIERVKGGGGDIIRVSSAMSGFLSIDETIEFRCDNVRPTMFDSKLVVQGQVMETHLTFDGLKVTGTIKSMESPEPKEIDKEMIESMILDNEIEFVLSTLDLEVGQKYRFPVMEGSSGTFTNTHVEVIEEMNVSVPAGDFTVFKVKIKTGENLGILYCTKDSPHMMVKHEIPAQGLTIELKEWTRK